MLTRVVFLLFLSLSPFAGAASEAESCGPATLLANSVRRGFWDSRLASGQSKYLKALVTGKNAPLKFEARWFGGKAYLIEPRFNTWIAVDGDSLEIAFPQASGEALRVRREIPSEFRKTGFLAFFKSPDRKQRLAFYDWYTKQVGTLLIAEHWKKLTALIQARAFTWDNWDKMVSLIELLAPNGILLERATAPYDRFRLRVVRHADRSVRIEFHTRVQNPQIARSRFGMLFEQGMQPVCDEDWKATDSPNLADIRTTQFESCRLSGDLFSISKHREIFPEDTLEDLLAGMADSRGNYLFDLYPHFGPVSMIPSNEGAKKWKDFVENMIVSSALDYLPEN